jgi:hypothetical protein
MAFDETGKTLDGGETSLLDQPSQLSADIAGGIGFAQTTDTMNRSVTARIKAQSFLVIVSSDGHEFMGTCVNSLIFYLPPRQAGFPVFKNSLLSAGVRSGAQLRQ